MKLLEEGIPLADISIERVARIAGVGKATIYRRWSGREELFCDVLRTAEPPDPELPGISMREDLIILLESLRRRGLANRSSAIMHNVHAQMKSSPKLWKVYHAAVIEPRRRMTFDVLRRGQAERRDSARTSTSNSPTTSSWAPCSYAPSSARTPSWRRACRNGSSTRSSRDWDPPPPEPTSTRLLDPRRNVRVSSQTALVGPTDRNSSRRLVRPRARTAVMGRRERTRSSPRVLVRRRWCARQLVRRRYGAGVQDGDGQRRPGVRPQRTPASAPALRPPQRPGRMAPGHRPRRVRRCARPGDGAARADPEHHRQPRQPHWRRSCPGWPSSSRCCSSSRWSAGPRPR